MSINDEETQKISKEINSLIQNVSSIIFIDRFKLEFLTAAKIAGGHVILADSHGVGKTSLAKALAQSIDWSGSEVSVQNISIETFNRIQCTVDLLPQDIIGFSRYEPTTGKLAFNRGPIFAHFVLCDEINLLTPKTQGSFFQAMEELSISIEGITYHLPNNFFIISTMNLKGAHLFPLPVPQLDRFMIRLSFGYPSELDETSIIKQHGTDNSWEGFKAVVPHSMVNNWRKSVDHVFIHDDIISYIVNLIRKTRNHPAIEIGASPRSGIKLSRLARALALVRGHNWVSADLIKEIFIASMAHRIVMRDPSLISDEILIEILNSTPIDNKTKHSKD